MDEVALAPLGGASATGDAATSAGDSRRKQHQLVPPTMLPNGIEYSICSVPRLIRRDLASVLPDVPIEHVLIVPCCQRSCIDLVNLGADVAAEKDRLLEVFAAWARDVRRRLMSDVHKSVSAGCAPERGSGSPEPVATAASTPAGAAAPGAAAAPLPEADVIAGPPSSPTTPGPWADFVDPCSGLPTFTANATVIYPEVDTMELLLRYRTSAAGPCKILTHPRWGSHVYPATLFAIAPLPALEAAFRAAAEAQVVAAAGIATTGSAAGAASAPASGGL